MAAFHGLDDDGSALSIRLALRKGRLAEVWMAWRDEVRLELNISMKRKIDLIF